MIRTDNIKIYIWTIIAGFSALENVLFWKLIELQIRFKLHV